MAREFDREATAISLPAELFGLLASQFPGGSIAVFDCSMRYQIVGGSLLESDPSLFEGKTVAEALHPDLAAQIVPLYEAALAGSSTSGKAIWRDRSYTVTTGPLRDGSGVIVGGVAVNTDVTEESHAIRDLARSERRNRQLFEGLQDAAIVATLDREIMDVNPAFETIFGYHRDEVIGRTTRFLYADEADYNLTGDAISDTEPLRKPLRFVREDGVEFVGEVSGGMLVFDEQENVSGYIALVRDVTVRETTARDLEDLQATRDRLLAAMLRAEELDRSRLASDLHDDAVQEIVATLYTVDRLISGASPALDRDTTETLAEVRDRLAGTLDRTRRLMFDLHPPLLEMRGVGPALETVADQLRDELDIRVVTDVPAVRLDQATESLIYRTFAEALANVRRHSQARNVVATMSLSDSTIHGSVIDDGVGFDVISVRQHRFSHLHLGLDAMRERVRLAGGDVVLTSQPGQGTHVVFEVPLGKPSVPFA
jgi:two-component system sensor histidine kinase UhpB